MRTCHRVSPVDLVICSNLSEYPFIIGMSPDPKPDEFVTLFDAQSPPVKVYAYSVDVRSVMNFLELERRMPGVSHPQLVGFFCFSLLPRRAIVQRPSKIGWKLY